jgi:hypothetical protein
MRARDPRSSRSDSFHAAELGVLARQQGRRARGQEKLGILGQLLVVDDRDRRPVVAVDLGERPAGSRDGRLEHVALAVEPDPPARLPEPEPQTRVAERCAQPGLELRKGGAAQRLAHDAAQHAAGEELRGDEREQEAVPEERAGDDKRPAHERAEVLVRGARDHRHLVARLDQEEDERDRRPDRERPAPRRRPRHEPVDQESRRGQRDRDDAPAIEVDEAGHDVRFIRDEQRIRRARGATGRDRAHARDPRREQRARCRGGSDEHARGEDRPVGARQAAAREGEDDREGGQVDQDLPVDAEREERRVARRLRDVHGVDQAEGDQHRAEPAPRPAVSPVEADPDRAEDDVRLLDGEPAWVGEEVGPERDEDGGRGRRDADDRRPELPPRQPPAARPGGGVLPEMAERVGRRRVGGDLGHRDRA